MRGEMPLLHGRQEAEQHPVQHPEERGAAAAGGGEKVAARIAATSSAELGAGTGAGARGPRVGARLLVQFAEASGSQEPAGGVQGGFGRAGEDAALRQERALLPRAAPGRAVGARAQLLGSPARAGPGPGPRALRDGGDDGAQHAAKDIDPQAARRGGGAAALGVGAAARRTAADLRRRRRQQLQAAVRGRDPSHRKLPGQVLEPGYQHQGVRLSQGDGSLQSR